MSDGFAKGSLVEAFVDRFRPIVQTERSLSIIRDLLNRAAKRGLNDPESDYENEVEMERTAERIQHHLDRAHDMPDGHAEALKLAEEFDRHCGTSQALRKASLRSGQILKDNSLNQSAERHGDEPTPANSGQSGDACFDLAGWDPGIKLPN